MLHLAKTPVKFLKHCLFKKIRQILNFYIDKYPVFKEIDQHDLNDLVLAPSKNF